MKASRRHELKRNTLALGLQSFPDFWRVYGTKILIALVLVLAIAWFIRQRVQTAHDLQEQATQAYAQARQAIGTLENISPTDPKSAEQRRAIQDQAERAISQVLEASSDDALKAEALVTRGDLNWTLAHLPEPSGSQTQPAAGHRESHDDLLENARKAYEAALGIAGAKPLSVTTARLGLGAIAEERKQWDEAKKQYEAIKNDPRVGQAFKADAQANLDNLTNLQTPVLLGKPTTEPAFPETGATTQSTATTESTAPTTNVPPSSNASVVPPTTQSVSKPATTTSPAR